MKYANAKIYIIRIHDDTYIGSTTQELQQHLQKQYEISKEPKRANTPLTKAFKENDFKDFTIELLKPFPCETLSELNEEKANYIKEYRPTLNTLKFSSREEWDRKYREKNTETLREKSKEYYDKNKEKILEKEKETIVCRCGKTVNKRKLKRHQSSRLCKSV